MVDTNSFLDTQSTKTPAYELLQKLLPLLPKPNALDEERTAQYEAIQTIVRAREEWLQYNANVKKLLAMKQAASTDRNEVDAIETSVNKWLSIVTEYDTKKNSNEGDKKRGYRDAKERLEIMAALLAILQKKLT